MSKSNHFDALSSNSKPENSSMTTVNILGRLRIATEQVRKVQSSLAKDGKRKITRLLLCFFLPCY